MKIIYPILFFLFAHCLLNAQTLPYWDWARNIVQFQSTFIALKISADPFGNVFVMGSTSVYAAPSLINDSGAFLAKYSRTGQFKWAKKIEGYPATICASPWGEVYIAGGHKPLSVPSNSPTSAFIAKYDANGNLIWNKN